MNIFMLTRKVLFPALVGVFWRGGRGLVWFCCCWVGFCFGFLEGFLHSLLLCFQDFKKFKKKSRAFCLLAFGKIFFFSIILPVEEEMNVHLFWYQAHNYLNTPTPWHGAALFCWMAKDQWDLDRGCAFLPAPSNKLLPIDFSLITRDGVKGAETPSLFFPNTWLLPKGLLPHFPSPVILHVWFCLHTLQERRKNEKWEREESSTLPTLTYTPHHTESTASSGAALGEGAQQVDTRLCWKSVGA